LPRITGNGCFGITSSNPSADFVIIDILLTPLVDAFGFRCVDTRSLPVFEELEFHVGDHAEDGDDHSTHASGRRDFGFKNTEGRALFIKLMNEIEDVAGGSPEPVKPQHNQFVARMQKLHDRLQLGPPLPGRS
jgi:hypothetical protein